MKMLAITKSTLDGLWRELTFCIDLEDIQVAAD